MNFVTDLAIILMAASVFTVISKALKQPLILGYIVAGFLVGPHLGLVPISSIDAIHLWSEIGIIFLLFALGLEFSFKKLLRVGSSALITALIKCIGMFGVGLLLGDFMHWTTLESIFLGGLMSMSSTTIIIKAYDDMGLKKKPYASLLFGSLVFEDLIAVLLMVLLSTLAASNQFAGGEMLWALGKLGFCLALWFVVGIFVIPSFLNWAHKYINDEIILMIAVGLCLLMVTLAELSGFSAALGAFVMGSILAETIEGERIEHAVASIKDLFGAIFFVSVGMMVDPAAIGEHWLPIIIITIVSMLGIMIFSTFGALLCGQGVKNSVHIGFSLAQLGEFAFIIAGLGCNFGVLREFIYPVVVAVSVITTFTTPYMIKASGPVGDWMIKHLPEKFVRKFEFQNQNSDTSKAQDAALKHLLRSVSMKCLSYGVIAIAIIIASRQYLEMLINMLIPDISATASSIAVLTISLAAVLPFLYLLSINNQDERRYSLQLIRNNRNNIVLVRALGAIKVLISIVILIIIVTSLVSNAIIAIVIITALSTALVSVSFISPTHNSKVEALFNRNLNQKEELERAARPITTSIQEKLASYQVNISQILIKPEFSLIGHTLREMPFRHVADINVLEIRRGQQQIRIPRGSEKIYPDDLLVIVGTDEEIEKANKLISDYTPIVDKSEAPAFSVNKIVISAESPLCGKTLRQSDLRAAGCVILSILHQDNFITNPKADERICEGDTVWLAGDQESCNWYK